MKIAIINGTNRIGNKTMNISKQASEIVSSLGFDVAIMTLENFTELFRGEYVSLDNADNRQRKDIEQMIEADVLLFIVPTYHKGIPTPLKNFLDTLDEDAVFDNKVIGFVASNKSQSFGADQAVQVVNGILSFGKLNSFIVPRVNIIDHSNIDNNRLREFIEYVSGFVKSQDTQIDKVESYYFGSC